MSVSTLHLSHTTGTAASHRVVPVVFGEQWHAHTALHKRAGIRTQDRRPHTVKRSRICCRALPEANTMLLAQLAEDLPSELPPLNEDVLLPLLFFTAPLCVYIAIRLLLWDYKSRPEDPRELKEAPWNDQKAQSTEERTYAWGTSPKPALQPPAPAEAISNSASALIVQAVMASQRLLRVRCAHDVLTASNDRPSASWYWTACLLGLPEGRPHRHMQDHSLRPAVVNVAADLAHRVTVPLAMQMLKRARNLND